MKENQRIMLCIRLLHGNHLTNQSIHSFNIFLQFLLDETNIAILVNSYTVLKDF